MSGKIGAHIFIITEGSNPQGNRGPVAVGFTEAYICVSVKWKQTHLRGGRVCCPFNYVKEEQALFETTVLNECWRREGGTLKHKHVVEEVPRALQTKHSAEKTQAGRLPQTMTEKISALTVKKVSKFMLSRTHVQTTTSLSTFYFSKLKRSTISQYLSCSLSLLHTHA